VCIAFLPEQPIPICNHWVIKLTHCYWLVGRKKQYTCDDEPTIFLHKPRDNSLASYSISLAYYSFLFYFGVKPWFSELNLDWSLLCFLTHRINVWIESLLKLKLLTMVQFCVDLIVLKVYRTFKTSSEAILSASDVNIRTVPSLFEKWTKPKV
jgi:hypothetical protein